MHCVFTANANIITIIIDFIIGIVIGNGIAMGIVKTQCIASLLKPQKLMDFEKIGLLGQFSALRIIGV